jgi:hypothetical protein
MTSNTSLGYKAPVIWNGAVSDFVPTYESLESHCIAAGCWGVALPDDDVDHIAKPLWTLGDKMVLNNYLYHPSALDERLIDFDHPRMDASNKVVKRSHGEMLFNQWVESVQYDTRRPIHDEALKKWEKHTTNFLLILRAHLTASAQKSISEPYGRRDPVATMSALLKVGMPTDTDITDSATDKLFGMEWDGGPLCNLRTKFEDVAKALVAAGEPEPTDSQTRALLQRVVNRRDKKKYGGAMQILTIGGEKDMDRWWRVLMNVEGKGGDADPPARKGTAPYRAHAAAAEEDYEREETRECGICHKRGHLAKACRNEKKAITCPCGWTYARTEPRCTRRNCDREPPRKESAKVAKKGKESAKLAKKGKSSDMKYLVKTVGLLAKGLKGMRHEVDTLKGCGSVASSDDDSDAGSDDDASEEEI